MLEGLSAEEQTAAFRTLRGMTRALRGEGTGGDAADAPDRGGS